MRQVVEVKARRGRPAKASAKLQVYIDSDVKMDLVAAAQAMDTKLGSMLETILRSVRGEGGGSAKFCMTYAEQRLREQKDDAA